VHWKEDSSIWTCVQDVISLLRKQPTQLRKNMYTEAVVPIVLVSKIQAITRKTKLVCIDKLANTVYNTTVLI